MPHRLQRIEEQGGVLWVDDSAATTPAATVSALEAFDRPAVVILGGVSKGVDFGPLARTLSDRAKAAILIGQAADDIASVLEVASRPGAKGLPVRKAASLADAVTIAREIARPGDVVLLSPACAAREDITTAKSADRFQSQEERGDRFAALVRALPPGATA